MLFSCSWVNAELMYVMYLVCWPFHCQWFGQYRCHETSDMISSYSTLVDVRVEPFRVGFFVVFGLLH